MALIATTLMSAIRTFVLPRGESTNLTRTIFLTVRAVFELRLRFAKTFIERDRIFAPFAPIGLLVLPFVWLIVVGSGYAGLFWAVTGRDWTRAFKTSGSSLFTLGVAPLHGFGQTIIGFSEAGLGLGLLALLIAYLPSMYASFQRRESAVALLEARAGSPPSARQTIIRYQRISGIGQIDELWPQWEQWFADVEESHTSLGAMAFFRSPSPERSWITAAGSVLDTASLAASTLDRPRNASAELCIRAGYLCLRRICGFFGLPYDDDPAPDDPISISRAEYDELCDALIDAGVALKPDRDQTWRDFQGWRVNYDAVLLLLAALVMAPPAPFSGDRLGPHPRARLTFRRKNRWKMPKS